MRKRPTSAPRIVRMLWSHFLSFLEIIGLRPEPVVDHATRVSELKLRYFQFRDLLSANNELLEVISGIEQRLRDRSPVTVPAVREQALTALTCTHRMVRGLNAISGNRYPALELAFSRIQTHFSASLSPRDEPHDELVLGLEALTTVSAPLVGAKMATLGEIRNKLHLPVPDGFAVTVAAFRQVLDGIGGPVALAGLGTDGTAQQAWAQAARRLILDAPIPPALETAVGTAYARLRGAGQTPLVSVRSSALDEDSDVSFAGQYVTVLNVPPHEIPRACRTVMASAYAPEVVFYRRHMGVDETAIEVAVGCMTMVDALASGVAFSSDPLGDDDAVLIHAVWGLGASIVNGEVEPDVYRVARGASPNVRISVGQKAIRVRAAGSGGTVAEVVPEDERNQRCLRPPEIETLARWVVELEEHFGARQDVEWALDRSRQLVILQSRPAHGPRQVVRTQEGPVNGAELLLEAGATAAHGAGSGRVVIATSSDALDDFPEGGVLVAPQSSPRFVRVMQNASAIVTDVGSAIGHMALLAREFNVPTIVGAGHATTVLRAGDIVTVDATRTRVYRGRIPALLETPPPRVDDRPLSRAQQLLAGVAPYIVPLSLTDPTADDFTPLACATLHDLARYIHERSFQEMFGIAALVGDFRSRTPILDVFLPIDLYVIDLGGGLACPPTARKVRRSQIVSAPFAALVNGMLHKGIPRFGPRSMDTKGFLQVVLRQAFLNPHEDDTLRDPCYAIISDAYVNLSARVGFHFSAVDAYCCEFQAQNYVAFRFKGGAADEIRRMRRVDAIARILRQLGFTTNLVHDLVTAQYVKQPKENTLRAIEMLGRLLQFMRQMDAAMTSEQVVSRVVDDFLAGRYGLEDPAG